MNEAAFWSGTGEEWEDYVFMLLQVRHGPVNIQRVPASDRGDLGLDSFCHSERCTYQCYAPEGDLSIDDRYRKHRAKLTTDIGKFIGRRDRILTLVGNLLISRWIFVVPRSDSRRLIEHASTKAEKVRQARLPYVATDFQILVNDSKDFAIESKQLVARQVQALQLPEPDIGTNIVQLWTDQNDKLTSRLKSKVKKLYPLESDDFISDKMNIFIKNYLQAENMLSALGTEFPDIWEAVLTVKRRCEKNLEFLGPNRTTQPSEQLRNQMNELSKELTGVNQLVSRESAEAIVRGTLSDWLIQCPLDF
jgi:hypothetical protein